jgi:PhnB protein
MSTDDSSRLSNQVIRPIPHGEHSVTPYLTVNNGSKAIDFYKRAFNAEDLFRETMPDGKILHARRGLAIPLLGYQMNLQVPLTDPLLR